MATEIPEGPGRTVNERLEALLKAMTDPARLRILGRLAEGARSTAALSEALGMPPGALDRHLQLLRESGLVREDTNAGNFLLDGKAVPQLLRDAAAQGGNASASGPAVSDESRSIQRRFFDGPKLRTMPAQAKMKEAVLEEILRRLPQRDEYPEKELNGLLAPIHPDFATLRRELVDFLYMERAGGIYKLTGKGRGFAGGQ